MENQCMNCGYQLQGKQTNFCSNKCSKKHYYYQAIKTCTHCSKQFRRIESPSPGACKACAECLNCGNLLNGQQRQYCSNKCSCAYKRHRNKAIERVFACKQCGKLTPKYNKTKYCSEKCRDGADRHRRRARKKDAFVEDVYLIDLIERDDCICKICNEPVDLNASAPDPFSASVDHIVPLSKGGKHSLANTQLAHLRCNLLKSDKIINDPTGV